MRQWPYPFVVAEDGHLWLNSRDGAAWQWVDRGAPPGRHLVPTHGTAVTAGGHPYVFAIGSDGHAWVHWWDGMAWHWLDQGTAGATPVWRALGAVAVSDGPGEPERPYAFYLAGNDPDTRVWTNSWDGRQWRWSDLGTAGGHSVCLGVGAVAVRDRPYAFVAAHDGHLWLNWWDGSARCWTDQGVPGGPYIRQPVGAVAVRDRPYAFVAGGDGHLWAHFWE